MCLLGNLFSSFFSISMLFLFLLARTTRTTDALHKGADGADYFSSLFRCPFAHGCPLPCFKNAVLMMFHLDDCKRSVASFHFFCMALAFFGHFKGFPQFSLKPKV